MSSSENLPENKRPDSSAAAQKPSEKPNNPQPSAAAEQGNTMSKQEQPVQAAQPVVIRQSSGKGLAAGALVLAVLGLGASGFLFVQGQNVLKNQELAFSQKISNAALGESENAALLKDNLNRQTVIQAELARLGDGQKANGEQIAQARAAYQELVKGRVNWLVDEAETMINIAAQQLQLSGNVQGAVGVLEHINERLSRFDQPDLLPIKQAVSNDLAALKNRPYVDVSGTALRLDRLETAVAGLPLMVDGVLKPGAAEPVAADTAASWWENAWQKSWDAVKNLVEIRHLDNNDAMLLAPEQIYFIRENLRLRLLDARTALLQQNGEVFQSDLNNVEATVKQYFDKNSPATQSWLKEIAELKTLDVRTVADDALKASLAAVHNYQDDVKMRRSAAQAETLPAEQAASEEAASAPAAASGEASESAKGGVEAPQLPSEKKASEASPAKALKADAVKGEKA
ncbi:uroporphyrinogen-III C-methyltransferase [Neisseria lisongii]